MTRKDTITITCSGLTIEVKSDNGFPEPQPIGPSPAEYMSMLLDAIAAVQAGQKANKEEPQANA